MNSAEVREDVAEVVSAVVSSSDQTAQLRRTVTIIGVALGIVAILAGLSLLLELNVVHRPDPVRLTCTTTTGSTINCVQA